MSYHDYLSLFVMAFTIDIREALYAGIAADNMFIMTHAVKTDKKTGIEKIVLKGIALSGGMPNSQFLIWNNTNTDSISPKIPPIKEVIKFSHST